MGTLLGNGVNAFSPQTTSSLTSPTGVAVVVATLDSTPPPPPPPPPLPPNSHSQPSNQMEVALIDTSSSPSATPSHVTSPTCHSVTSSNLGGVGVGGGGGGVGVGIGVNITSPTAPSLASSSTAPSSAAGLMAGSSSCSSSSATSSTKMMLRDPHVPASLLKLWYR